MPDFFLDEFLTTNTKPASSAAPKPSAPSKGQVEQVFKTITAMANEELVKKTNAVYAFEVRGEEEGTWYLDLKNGSGSAGRGLPPTPADATLVMDGQDFVKMFKGDFSL